MISQASLASGDSMQGKLVRVGASPSFYNLDLNFTNYIFARTGLLVWHADEPVAPVLYVNE